ncbi:PREDICTED: centrosomal protein of 128 kDa-like [Camelina sativa]|uniref:Centrosomal protein of 128 kDa-like n=1 Tax=Camelina sativa TaxID=90675 RepID=A0ABM0W0M3_CAMSA|nr:PREDICTED: centrosomal protein of 128 kDa-like [Camelina sativa]
MVAKKKASRNSNETATNDNPKAPEADKKATAALLSRQSSMEEHDSSEERFKNLKSLNEMLLKQTMEKRNQIDSLVHAKDELETELARFASEKMGLCGELDQVSDENFGLKIELGLVVDFVESRFREMGVGVERLIRDGESEIRVLKGERNELMGKVEMEKEEIRKVCDERDFIKNRFDLQSEEANRLKECVVRLEEKESDLEIVIGKLKSENDKLVKEREMREELIEVVNKEKFGLEKTIEDGKKEIDGLKSEIEALLSEKNEMESVKIEQKGEILELEKKLDKLNETVQSLTKDERVLKDLVISLEKNLNESMEKERRMIVEIDALGKEKTVKESELKRLVEEKNSVEKQMDMVNMQSSDKEKLIDQLSREKIELEERVFSREVKLDELNQKADELTHAVAVLQRDCDDQTEINDQLSCKVGQLSDAIVEVELKKKEADKALEEEKRHGEDLKAKVLKSEKMTETTSEELEKIKIECERLFTAKNDLESQSESLKSEKAIVEKELVQLKKAMDALKAELESARMDAKRSLVMVKSVASMLSQLENQEDRLISSEQQKRENGTESYVVELESIEKAFKNKEDIIEEMKKEAEIMKQSTEEAHKKQNFWTLVSSVTTVFAAASFVYAARTRTRTR